MSFIREIIQKQDCSIEELISCFEQVKKNGDIAVIKFDGERTVNEYTIFITFPLIKKREMIRADVSDLKKGLIKVLIRYIEGDV
ncbi:hypothetical protein [Pedobacter sp. FW305-3-2-15-E-R2A2]|uniref:hypothetical protein n=1 Tax=Pedobacter sp. FW305-3-2-15-E-R2A2 TaxID=3140251 RepID=UPI003140C878